MGGARALPPPRRQFVQTRRRRRRNGDQDVLEAFLDVHLRELAAHHARVEARGVTTIWRERSAVSRRRYKTGRALPDMGWASPGVLRVERPPSILVQPSRSSAP